MPDDSVQVKVGFVPDTASNAQMMAELAKMKAEIDKIPLELDKAAKGASSLQKELAGISRASQLEKIAKDMGAVAKETGDVGKAVADLTAKMKELGATDDEIKNVARSFASASESGEEGSGSGGGGKNSELISKFAGVGRMAGVNVEQFAGIAKAQEAVQQLSGGITSSLIPGLESGAAGAAATGLAFGVVAIAMAVLIKLAEQFAAQIESAKQDVTAAFNGIRTVQEAIRGGMTSEDARAKVAELGQQIEDEQGNLARAQESYKNAFSQLANGIPIIGDLIARIADLLGVFSPFKDEVKTAETNAKGAAAEQKQYNIALENGKFAAADAKKAAEEAAKAQDKAAKDAEAASRKAEAEQQKAQAAAEQAAKELAQQQQQQEDMQIKFGETIKKIAQSSQDAIADIYRKNADSTKASFTKLGRDMAAIDQKSIDAVADAQIKANQAEQNAVKEHNRALAEIQKNAADAEEDARENRNFLQLADARKDAQRAVGGEDTKFGQGEDDRAAAIRQENEDRKRELARAKRDRQLAFGQEGEDRREGLAQALRDQQINKQRQLRDARTAYQSEEATFQRHLQNMLQLRGQALNAETQMVQAQVNAVTGAGRGPTAAPSNTFNSHQTINNTTIPMTTIGMGSALQMLNAAGFGR